MQLTAYKVSLLFLKIGVIRIIKTYFPFPSLGRGELVKKRPRGRKIRLLMKFFKSSHVIYHSIRNLMLITKSIESSVWKFSRKKLQAYQSNLCNGFFYFLKQWFFFLKSIHTNFCTKNWAYCFYHTRSMETKIPTCV